MRSPVRLLPLALLWCVVMTICAAASFFTLPHATALAQGVPVSGPVYATTGPILVQGTPPGSATPTPVPTAPPTATPTIKPTAAPSAMPTSGSALWQIGNPSVTANTGQCGAATFPSTSSADFMLAKNPGCMRNQLNPVGNGGSGVYFLSAGTQYTWDFQTVTHMGIDTGKFTQRLIWQVHDYACGMSPLTVLGIQNMTGGTTGQTWYFQSGGKLVTFPYVEGATDTWKIVVVPSTASAGSAALYRNGSQLASWPNINTFACGAKPWWNFGPYMWDWTNGNAVSSLTTVEMLFNYMRLSSP